MSSNNLKPFHWPYKTWSQCLNWPVERFCHRGPLACSSRTSPARSSPRRCSSPTTTSVSSPDFSFEQFLHSTFLILATGSNTCGSIVERNIIHFIGLISNLTPIGVAFGIIGQDQREVAHPEILDDGSDDHPGPTAAPSAVHQAVAALLNTNLHTLVYWITLNQSNQISDDG